VFIKNWHEDIESIDIAGHTDNTGLDAYNYTLSEIRAMSVRQYLVTRGIEPSLISAHDAGEYEPIVDNSSPAGRAAKRRVDLRINGTGLSVE
jgi:OmpA-OmpF porin, OOP family